MEFSHRLQHRDDLPKLEDGQDLIALERQPLQIADRLWWVGHYLEGDSFQCHAYLLEQGDESVLFDPGSNLTFRHTLAKIEQVIPFSSIKWFVCHHQDPDITGALALIDQLVSRPDARLVSHWRAEALLKHLGLSLPFWLVEDHDWQLQLPDRLLRFVFTPYAHFPGAFVTFDTNSGTLLSSDLFGGFTEGSQLVAQDLSYFEAMRPFHEHYIPSREVLAYALDKVSALPLTLIAPQHGCIIPKALIAPIIRELRQLECGLYLVAVGDTDIRRMVHLNRVFHEMTQILLDERDFHSIALALTRISAEVLPVDEITFYVPTGDETVLCLDAESRYRGKRIKAPAEVQQALATVAHRGEQTKRILVTTLTFDERPPRPTLIVPLYLADASQVGAVAAFWLREQVEIGPSLHDLFRRVGPAIEVAVEREAMRRALEIERDRIYERSIRDPLTGLYTRRHMKDTVNRWTRFQDRDETRMVSVVMLDLDYFKRVNDTYGHISGDKVLICAARIMQEECRDGDLPVRMGGEEFALFLFGDNSHAGATLATRILARVREVRFEGELAPLRLTVSAGTTCRLPGETLDDVINRADKALYESKHGGRDRVMTR